MTGEDPETVDHINKITSDNRFVNLRSATRAENTRHCFGHRDRKYPGALKGAYRHKGGWLAFVGFEGKQFYIGVYKTEVEAHQAYLNAAARLHGQFHSPA